MGKTVIEKIIASHLVGGDPEKDIRVGGIVDVEIDCRIARDFGGANVVKNLEEMNLTVADTSKTFFTFDTNPTGSDQKYAANQQRCRDFARANGLKVYDIDQGIGTHLSIFKRIAAPGSTLVSTDSHANILGAICAFGQGMGDVDIAACWAHGSVWFKVPRSVKVILKGKPSPACTPKDVVLEMARHFGANGLLGCAAELQGEYVDELPLSGRVTISSMGTEMGAIILLFPPPSPAILHELGWPADMDMSGLLPDEDATYDAVYEVDLSNLKGPMIARPGHPDDAVPLSDVRGKKIDSCFIGSCTNGSIEDLRTAAAVLRGRQVAPGVILKIVPSTRVTWMQCMSEGLIDIFMEAGAVVGNAGCAGCAAGQIGQNGPGEVTVSTGNRNFPGKQGKGLVYLASPGTVAASAVAGFITSPDEIPAKPAVFEPKQQSSDAKKESCKQCKEGGESFQFEREGKAWVINMDNIDTDMIFHNAYLQVTDLKEMGQYAFGNLAGYEEFSSKVKPGDVVFVGKNFGCGSSRQQAVDCFKALGVSAIVGKSYGAIYERNAVNAGFPIITAPEIDMENAVKDGDTVKLDLNDGGKVVNITQNMSEVCSGGFSSVQMSICQRGGLLCDTCEESW